MDHHFETQIALSRRAVRLGRALGVLNPRLRHARAALFPRDTHEHERLQELLTHARASVPYYREHLPESAPTTLEAFPVITRNDLKTNFADLLTRDSSGRLPNGPLTIMRTGGSTGVPASHVRANGESAFWDGVMFARLLHWLDVPRDCTVADLGLHLGHESRVEGYLFPPYRVVWLNARGFFNPEMSAESLDLIEAGQPTVITGLPSRMLQLADAAEARGIALRPAHVVSSYEQLTGTARTRLEEAFQAPVANLYGSVEVGLAAWECAEGRMHFHSDMVIPEVLDSSGSAAGSGESGRLVMTSLKGTAMPLIRYDTGDLAVAADDASCACGSAAPSIMRLEGRAAARAVTGSGRLVSPYTLMVHIDALGLEEYQVVQDVPGELRLVTGQHISLPSDSAVRVVAEKLSAWAGESIQIKPESSGDYVLSTAGKRNPFASRIGHG